MLLRKTTRHSSTNTALVFIKITRPHWTSIDKPYKKGLHQHKIIWVQCMKQGWVLRGITTRP